MRNYCLKYGDQEKTVTVYLRGVWGKWVRQRFFRNCVNSFLYINDEIMLLMVMAKVLAKSPFLDIDLRQDLDEQKPLS